MERYGIIGLGRMGSAIAARLAAQGKTVAGWTRSGLSDDRATMLGIAAADSIPALVAASDVIITSLYDDTAVAEVLQRLLSCPLDGRLIVETSTVVPTLVTDRADAIATKGGMIADAPISGGPEMVGTGTCGIFLGGTPGTVARAQTALAPVTGRVVPVGPLGAGLVMKAINNGLLQAYVSGLRDLLPMARAAGLPLETVLTVLSKGPAGLPMITDRIPKILGHDTEVGFGMAGVAKDNDVFLRMVAGYGLSAPSLEYAGEIQRAAVAEGFGDKDPAALIAAAYDNG